MTEAAAGLSSVEKRYGKTVVLRIEDLALERGGIHIITGPNGAGKTTLLRLLVGLETAEVGTISVLGRRREGLSPEDRLELARRLGFCPQAPYLFSSTVRANVEYPLAARGVPRGERTTLACKAMEQLGVEHLAERDARVLSTGEAKRVALARAIVAKPELLLLDEPLASIDTDGAELVERLLPQLASDGVTVVAATHVVEQAYRLSARVVRLERGQIAPAAENLLEGSLVDSADGSGASFRTDAGPVLEVVTDRRGRARVSIDPTDIVVSTHPLDSSALNSLPGKVTSVRRAGASVLLTADVGFPLVAKVTAESCRKLGLTVGVEVVLTFKASAVVVY